MNLAQRILITVLVLYAPASIVVAAMNLQNPEIGGKILAVQFFIFSVAGWVLWIWKGGSSLSNGK